ncbi:predicted protein [Naegleria gruberi]|uniref:rRNA adenine N(6)-methyltransferase n=1 Tax=Naegleria gruberi TaxID=5762 RepID=D2W0P8_NAEGR|nr:uncharacterized protein NAEGRDRAFT_74936 [Naegleria gruberi]EFC37330.1 predicted protein [Naegleria gruberi]|eukprot:XP_002670074.1 predicted protein [Naegleria gruberi strain NEG-M]
MYGLQASKQLSQNFLLNLHVTDKIVRVCGDISNKTVIEIGPGPGCLTRSILQANPKRLIVVEKDERFMPALQNLQQSVDDGKMHIVQGDILKVDQFKLVDHFLEKDEKVLKNSDELANVVFIGNLPFGIATPLLINWLKDCANGTGAFAFGKKIPMVLMFQKEVGLRMSAKNSTKEFGRLSVSSQSVCDVEHMFVVNAKSFVPAPKVDASVMRLIPKTTPLIDNSLVQFEDLEQFCRIIFNGKRKQLNTNLSSYFSPKQCAYIAAGAVEGGSKNMDSVNAVLSQRSQDLTVEEITSMARRFVRLRESDPAIKDLLKRA